MSTDNTEAPDEESNGMPMIGLRVPQYAFDVINRLAEKQDRSKSAIVRDWVMGELDERNFLTELDEEVKREMRADGSGED